MKQIKPSELRKGNIFTKRMELHGRESFEVKEVPEEKSYIIVRERNNPKITRRMFVGDLHFCSKEHFVKYFFDRDQ